MIAVDVGNARIKVGWFHRPCDAAIPQPDATLPLDGRAPDFTRLNAWIAECSAATATTATAATTTGGPSPAPLCWYIGSVNRPSATRLIDWLRTARPQDRVTLLAAGDLPLEVKVARPDMVGVDRLLDALAAAALCGPGQAAVVIDVGTAITVDLLSAEGAFLGGAILPGIAMSARAMHEFTDLLPLVDITDLDGPPPALGDETEAAMRSGLFWGAVGAVRQLIHQLAGEERPRVILTGGAGPAVARLLSESAILVPHLTLAGIALAARALP
jgi:type III pantothenate kinase